MYEKFTNCPKLAKTNPALLISVVRIIEKGDGQLAIKNKPKTMRGRAINIILQSIDERFSKELSDLK